MEHPQQQEKQAWLVEIPDGRDLASVRPDSTAPPTDNPFSRKIKPKPPVLPQFRTILPLPPKETSTVSTRVKPLTRKKNSLVPPRGCGLSICRRSPCTLKSHWHYAKTLVEKSKQQDNEAEQQETRRGAVLSRATTSSTSSTTPSSAVPSSASTSASSLSFPLVPFGAVKLAASPILPLDGCEQELSALQKLHNDFFTKIVTHMHMVIITPFTNRPTYIMSRNQELYDNSIAKRVDCLNFIGAAHVFFSVRSRLRSEQDSHVGMFLHTTLMKSLRDLLEDYVPARDADVVLSTIFTLVMVDLNVQRGRRLPASLVAHREGMIKVVSSLGGLHNAKHSLPFIIHLDRVIATQMRVPPLYTTWESVTMAVQRASLYPARYGSFFDTDQRNEEINTDITAYCTEVCRAIEIFEGEEWNYNDLRSEPLTAEIYYFYFLRNRVIGQFVWINARYAKENTKQRCILLATKVVEYSVLMDNYIVAISMGVADTLLELLHEQDVNEVWDGCRDVLTWITFVLVCMPDYYDQWNSAMEFCYKNLMHIYGVQRLHGLAGWEEVLLENCKEFVWSEKLDSPYANACAQLRHMSMKRSQ